MVRSSFQSRPEPLSIGRVAREEVTIRPTGRIVSLSYKFKFKLIFGHFVTRSERIFLLSKSLQERISIWLENFLSTELAEYLLKFFEFFIRKASRANKLGR